jgi:hypothetical protein
VSDSSVKVAEDARSDNDTKNSREEAPPLGHGGAHEPVPGALVSSMRSALVAAPCSVQCIPPAPLPSFRDRASREGHAIPQDLLFPCRQRRDAAGTIPVRPQLSQNSMCCNTTPRNLPWSSSSWQGCCRRSRRWRGCFKSAARQRRCILVWRPMQRSGKGRPVEQDICQAVQWHAIM